MDKEKVQKLLALKQLFDSGILTEEEMNHEKKKVLSSPDYDNQVEAKNSFNELMLSKQGDQSSSEKVTIHGYDGFNLIRPSVSIYCDDIYLGEIGYNEELEVEIDGDCLLKFTVWFRSSSVIIKKGLVSHVFLFFNRFTGGLNALPSDEINYYNVLKKKESIIRNGNIYSIIFIFILICVYLLFMWIQKEMLSNINSFKF